LVKYMMMVLWVESRVVATAWESEWVGERT
jgi:hypothetical protein